MKIKNLLILAFCCFNAQQSLAQLQDRGPRTANPTHPRFAFENILRAEKEKTEILLNEIKRLKTPALKKSVFSNLGLEGFVSRERPRDPRCDDDDNNAACAQNCSARFSDGSCYSYGTDYCGPRAACSAHCTARFSDGNCYSYSADFCGPDAVCSPNCTARFSDGKCYSYGPDLCF